ncbi:MAG TPA: hypothetical protein VF266_06565, partial [Thermoanaerobaculia bacterium]
PDGTMMAGYLRGRPGIVVYSLQDREHRPITSSGSRPLWIAPREILYADAGRLRIVNVDTKANRDVATPFPISGMSLSADARTLVFSDRIVRADVWMADLGEPKR